MPFYHTPRNISAFDAKFEAQKIAFGPISFQVAHCLLKFDILATIDKAAEDGISLASYAYPQHSVNTPSVSYSIWG